MHLLQFLVFQIFPLQEVTGCSKFIVPVRGDKVNFGIRVIVPLVREYEFGYWFSQVTAKRINIHKE